MPIFTGVKDSCQLVQIVPRRPSDRLSLRDRTALIKTLQKGLAAEGIYGVVLTGHREWFCPGFIRPPAEESSYAEFDIYNLIRSSSKPVVAAVNGHALEEGLGLVLSCRTAISVHGVRFGTSFVDGMASAPGEATTRMLVNRVGYDYAASLLYRGKSFDEFEARRIGVIDDIVTREYLIPRATRHAWLAANDNLRPRR